MYGSLAISQATIVQDQAWMGHADVQTTMKYMHHRRSAGGARLLSATFQPMKKRAGQAGARTRDNQDGRAMTAARSTTSSPS